MCYIPGYNIERNDRKSINIIGQSKIGGGVACYIKQNYTYQREDEELNISNADLETLRITILIL